MSLNADSMSVLNMRMPVPNLSRAITASSKEQYETVANTGVMPSFILEAEG